MQLTGILRSATTDRKIKHDHEELSLVQNFEADVIAGHFKWKDFQGQPHKNISGLNGRVFKAHFYKYKNNPQCIKLYLDPSNGNGSKHRAIYSLQGTQLQFEAYESH